MLLAMTHDRRLLSAWEAGRCALRSRSLQLPSEEEARTACDARRMTTTPLPARVRGAAAETVALACLGRAAQAAPWARDSARGQWMPFAHWPECLFHRCAGPSRLLDQGMKCGKIMRGNPCAPHHPTLQSGVSSRKLSEQCTRCSIKSNSPARHHFIPSASQLPPHLRSSGMGAWAVFDLGPPLVALT